MIDAAHHRQRPYNQHVQQRSFQVGDTVWLALPTAGKLDPKWEGDGQWGGGASVTILTLIIIIIVSSHKIVQKQSQ